MIKLNKYSFSLVRNSLFISLISFLLQGCIFVVGAAAGAAAIAVVYDHRTIERTIEDTQLANKIVDKIHSIPALHDESHIEITVFNRIVLITGQVPYPAWRRQTEELARSVPGISRIYNQLTVQGPTSTLTRTSDSWITTKIKSEMLATEDLKSSTIKVVTENGIVYLMGVVTQQQANIAIDISRQVSGVQKVIKIFQYMK